MSVLEGAREERDGDTFHCQEGGQAPGKAPFEGMRVEEGAAGAKLGLGSEDRVADEARGWGGVRGEATEGWGVGSKVTCAITSGAWAGTGHSLLCKDPSGHCGGKVLWTRRKTGRWGLQVGQP